MTRAILKFKGTQAQVLASLTEVGATIDPAHILNTGATKTIYMKGLKSVSKRSTANIRLDTVFISNLTRTVDEVQYDRGPHVDMLIRGKLGAQALQKYIDKLAATAEENLTMPPEFLAKWPGLAKKGKTIAGATLVYHTPLDPENPTGLDTPLTKSAHDFV